MTDLSHIETFLPVLGFFLLVMLRSVLCVFILEGAAATQGKGALLRAMAQVRDLKIAPAMHISYSVRHFCYSFLNHAS